ncbi:nuclear transport factor 2 family protein [Echinicola sp. CAU 1574]|uniref:Nuclear transport factor 2 family protein n=1 Tax=Echinicola arenosa TaxID=2774144 RepID=A0ABR9AFP7_9BACT|nr:nuclear transport factor 2 family protein [Echinicola arenosa]MBD8487677.1 nuclear transport factor 2 family protein [Echinicola arenosa]
MKKFLIILLLCIASVFSVQAQSENSIELVKAVQELTNVMINPDKAKLKKLTDKKLSYGHSSGKNEDQETFINTLISGKSDFVSIDLENQSYEVVDDIGIARHILVAETNDGGAPGNVRIGVLMIWRKNDNSWKLLARQAYKLPQP